jgi:RecA DNA recombination protein
MRPEELVVEGGITEIFGRTSSGRTSLLVACLREVTRRGAVAALVDTDHVFDPVGAARTGVELSRVLWVRCGRRSDRALRAADLLVRCPGFTLVALDTGAFTPRLTLAEAYRLKLAVLRSRTALVIVTRHRIVAAGATLALETSRRGCRWAGQQPAPTRLEGAGTAVAVARARGPAVDLRPGTVHLAWWNA